MINIRHVMLAALFIPAAASAQMLQTVSVQPAQIKAGESAKITVTFNETDQLNCGIRLHFGDGSTQDYKINQRSDSPLVVTRTYAKPGDMRVMAEPKTQGLMLGCGGKNQTTTLKVAAAEAATAAKSDAKSAKGEGKGAKAEAKAASPTCPAGWTLNAKSVSKAGAYTCTAKPGTDLPAARVACPDKLDYFESKSRGQLGCRS